jgi:hypothetical protein
MMNYGGRKKGSPKIFKVNIPSVAWGHTKKHKISQGSKAALGRAETPTYSLQQEKTQGGINVSCLSKQEICP